MSKRKTSQRNASTHGGDLASETGGVLAWSKTSRYVASLAILAYLAIVILGPLSNPVASEYFSTPLAERIAPIHRALFMGHGYRFFAPDPGPSHRLVYRGVRADGTEFSGYFPNRKTNRPRLMYHRWFMLSETMFNEQIMMPSKAQFEVRSHEYDVQIANLRKTGKVEMLEELTLERELITEQFEKASHRIEILASSIARVLLRQNNGASIELFVQERKIPFPDEVTGGLRLDDEGLLTEMVKIGELDAEGYRTSELEPLPVQEESK